MADNALKDFADFASPPESPEEAFERQRQRDIDSAATSNLFAAQEQAPDDVAEARRVGGRLGVPAEYVIADKSKQLHKAAAMQAADEELARVPTTRRHVAETPGFAAMTRDALPEMSEMERTARAYARSPYAEGEKLDFSTIEAAIDSSAAAGKGYIAEFGINRARSWYGANAAYYDFMGYKNKAEAARQEIRGLDLASRLLPQAESFSGQLLHRGLFQVIQAPYTAASFAVSAPVGLGAIALETSSAAYGKYTARGATGVEAISGALIEGTAEAAFEKIPMGFLFKRAGSSAAKFIRDYLLREVPSEIATTLVTGITDTAIANPEKTWADWAHSLPEDLAHTTVGAIMGGGFMSGMHAMARNGAQAHAATAGAKHLAELTAAGNASVLLERDPKMLAEYVQSIQDDSGSPLTQVYVPAMLLQEAIDREQIKPDALSQSTLEGLAEAAEMNGDHAVPIGEYIAHVATSAAGQKIAEQARTNPGGMTALEAELYLKNAEERFNQDAAKILATYDEIAPFRQGAKMVYEEVLTGLNSTNRFTSSVNSTYAALYREMFTTLAHKHTDAGKPTTPDALWNQYKVKFTATGVPNAEALAQMEKRPSQERERQEGRDEAVKTVNGLLKSGKISAGHAFRGGSLAELQQIARTGRLVVGSSFEGRAGTSAAPIGEGLTGAYGHGFGYIIPPHHYTRESGIEVMVDTRANPRDMLYVAPGGKVMNFEMMKAYVSAKGDLDFTGIVSGDFQQSMWYAPLVKAVQDVQREAGTAEEWKGIIGSLKGVKAEERAASGVMDWLTLKDGITEAGKPVRITKADLLEALKEEGTYKITEIHRGHISGALPAADARKKRDNTFPEGPETLAEARERLENSFEDDWSPDINVRRIDSEVDEDSIDYDYYREQAEEEIKAEIEEEQDAETGEMLELSDAEKRAKRDATEKRIEKRAEEMVEALREADGLPMVYSYSDRGDSGIDFTVRVRDGEWSLFQEGDHVTDGSARNTERALDDAVEKMEQIASEYAYENDENSSERQDEWVTSELRDQGFDLDEDEDVEQGQKEEAVPLPPGQTLPAGIPEGETFIGRAGWFDYTVPGAVAESYTVLSMHLDARPTATAQITWRAVTAPAASPEGTTTGAWVISSEKTGELLRHKDGSIREFKSEGAATLTAERMSQAQKDYTEGHLTERKNLIGFARMTAREAPTGEKVLFVEELQSDWAGAAKEIGAPGTPPKWFDPAIEKLPPKWFAQKSERGEWNIVSKKGESLTRGHRTKEEAEATGLERYIEKMVPTGPFVQKTEAWMGLLFKRIMRYAAENGIDTIAWTTGGQQAERYPHLRHVAEAVELRRDADGDVTIHAFNEADSEIYTEKVEDEIGDVARYVGPEIAEQLFARRLEADKIRESFAEGAAVESPSEGVFMIRLPKSMGGGLHGGNETPNTWNRSHEAETALATMISTELDALDIGKARVEGAGMEVGRYKGASKVYDEIARNTLHGVMRQLGHGGVKVQPIKVLVGPSTLPEGKVSVEVAQKILGERYTPPKQKAADKPPAFPAEVNAGDFIPFSFPVLEASRVIQGIVDTAVMLREPLPPLLEGEVAQDDEGRVRQAVNHLYGEGVLARGIPHVIQDGAETAIQVIAAADKIMADPVLGAWMTETQAYYAAATMHEAEQKAGAARYKAAFLARANAAAVEGVEQQGFKITPALKETVLGSMPLMQPTRGEITFGGKGATIGTDPTIITLLQNADLSTFLHETGHFFLEVMADIASSEGAPPGVIEDMGRTLAWFGIEPASGMTPLERWRSMTTNEKRAYHEQWARGFERYLMEGKAPSVELKGLFSKFRSWLVNVYRALTHPHLNVPLNDEVRGVMDRLLATDKQIDEVGQLSAVMPLFKTAADAGFDEEQWIEYQRVNQQAKDEAANTLDNAGMRDMAWTRNAKSKALRALHADAQEKRERMTDEVTTELEANPVYRARWFIQTGEAEAGEKLPAHRLDMAALKAMYGTDPAAPWRYLPAGARGLVAAEGGVHPDHVAEMYGFKSGDEMVREILAAPALERAVEEEVDVRMLERYGDVSTPQALARAAEKAVHNQVRTRMVATELVALKREMGSITLLNRAAKAMAETLIAAKRLSAIKPIVFDRIQAKASREAEEALKAGSRDKAATAKRNQLLGIHGARVASAALEEVESGRAYLAKVDKSSTVDPEYRDQIEKLLERFELRPMTRGEVKKRASLAEFIKNHEEIGLPPQITPELQAEAERKPYTEMTLTEFRGLVDAVKQIEHLGRLKHKLLNAKEKREFKQLVTDLGNGIRDKAKSEAREPERAGQRYPGKGAVKFVKGFAAEHRTFTSILRELDGWVEAGPMWETLGRRANEQADVETQMRADSTAAFATIVSKVSGLTQKVDVPEVGAAFSREELIGIGLNMGNAVNRERVLMGEKWTPVQLDAVLRNLRAEDVAAIEAVWKMIEKFKPQMEEKHLRVFGHKPEWVTPEPFTFPGTDIKTTGGYYPISYDRGRSIRSNQNEAAAIQRQIERGEMLRASTRRGHLEERAKSTGMKLRYDFMRVTAQHVNQVVHDLAWHEYLVDANRILKSEQVSGRIVEHYGSEIFTELQKTLTDIAVGNARPLGHFENAASHLRKGAAVSIMAWSVTTFMQQPLGVSQSMVRIGPWNFMRGLGKWIGGGDVHGMEATQASVRAKSTFMRNRALTQNREMEEILNRVESEKGSALRNSYFYMIHAMQNFVDMPTWLGHYDAMIAEGKDEETAASLADQAVKDSQGSGLIHDRAGVLRGNEFKQMWTLFGAFFNSTYNLAVEQGKRTEPNPISIGKSAAAYAALTIIPATLSAVLMMLLKGDDEWKDPKKLGRKLAAENVAYLLNTIMFVRELSQPMKQAIEGKPADYSGPAGITFFSQAGKLLLQAQQGEFDRGMLKAAVSTSGALFHFPATQVNRMIDYVWAKMHRKDVEPQSFLGGPPAKQLK